MSRVVFSSNSIEVLHQDFGGEVLFVTFNELGMVANGKRFWGDVLFEKMGISSIGIVSSEPNWYPLQDMQSALAAIKSHSQGRKLITYGHSQGGYGALKFSREMGAAKALAFCPQWCIDPDLVAPYNDRYTRYYKRDLRNGDQIRADDLCSECYVVYDPSDPEDEWNAKKILQFPGAARVICPFGAHGVVRLITEAGASSDFIRALLLEPSKAKGELRKVLRQSRYKSRTYQSNFVRSAKVRKHFSLAEPCCVKFQDEARFILEFERACRKSDGPGIDRLVTSAKDETLAKAGWYSIWSNARKNKASLAEVKIAHVILKTKPEDASRACMPSIRSFSSRNRNWRKPNS